MSWPIIALGDLTVKIGSGATPQGGSASYKASGIPFVRSMNVHDGEFRPEGLAFLDEFQAKALDHVTLSKDDVLLNITGASVARACRLPRRYAGGRVNQHVAIIRPKPDKLYPDYLAHCLIWPYIKKALLRAAGSGATREAITKTQIEEFAIPLPPIDAQRRVAATLDQADDLRRSRRNALDRTNAILAATFFDMFGDPANNPKAWPMRTLGEASIRFSDGPFGSNLKTEHYVETGIRVIRLQNIGVGEFIDTDRAYISEKHFGTLRTHTCVPGDILIGTLGDPNLRAVIQPNYIPVALNKADCVQMRVNPKICVSEYVCALLNCPSTERMAQDKILGQTRLRISMGRLRELSVPIPPVGLQDAFAVRVAQINKLKANHRVHLTKLDVLFAALQHRAFRGEL